MPREAPRSKTQCASLPSSAASGGASRRRSNQRCTLTIGESSSATSSSPTRRALSRGGTATTTASASRSSSVSTRAPSTARRRARARARRRPRASQPSGRSGSTRSAFARGPSSAVRTVNSPASASASSARRLSAGRMKTSQKRSTAASDAPCRRSSAPNVSPGRAFAPRSRSSTSGMRTRSRAGRCRYASSAGRLGLISATVPSSAITGSASRVRETEPPSPTRSRKRRYSVKQPSAMCWPLSGGGSGSPSRSGSVWTAPPSVGRASCSVHLPARVDEVERGREPGEAAADDGDPHRRDLARDDARASPASRAGTTCPNTSKPFASMRSSWPGRARRTSRRRARCAGRASRAGAGPRRGARGRAAPGTPSARATPASRRELGYAEARQLVLRQVDAPELLVLGDVAHDVDQLQRDPSVARARCRREPYTAMHATPTAPATFSQ